MQQQSPSLASVTFWFGTKASYLLFMYFIHADVLTCVHCVDHPYSCHALLQWPFNNANIPPTKTKAPAESAGSAAPADDCRYRDHGYIFGGEECNA